MKARTQGGGKGWRTVHAARASSHPQFYPRDVFLFLFSLLFRVFIARLKREPRCVALGIVLVILAVPFIPPGDRDGEGIAPIPEAGFFAFEIRRLAGSTEGTIAEGRDKASLRGRNERSLKRDVQRIFLSLSCFLFPRGSA